MTLGTLYNLQEILNCVRNQFVHLEYPWIYANKSILCWLSMHQCKLLSDLVNEQIPTFSPFAVHKQKLVPNGVFVDKDSLPPDRIGCVVVNHKAYTNEQCLEAIQTELQRKKIPTLNRQQEIAFLKSFRVVVTKQNESTYENPEWAWTSYRIFDMTCFEKALTEPSQL